MNDWVDDVLKDWGAWARGHSLQRGHQSPLARMMAMGALPAMSDARFSDSPGYIPPSIEAVEGAIGRMGLQSRRLRRIVMRFYIGQVGLEELALRETATKETVESWLHEAKCRIADELKLPEVV